MQFYVSIINFLCGHFTIKLFSKIACNHSRAKGLFGIKNLIYTKYPKYLWLMDQRSNIYVNIDRQSQYYNDGQNRMLILIKHYTATFHFHHD